MDFVQVYFLLLLFMFIALISGCIGSLKYAPIKIKVVYLITFFLLLLRCIALLFFLASDDISYIALCKAVFISDYICIPVGAITTLYILWRNDKLKFDALFIPFFLLAAGYMWMIYKLPVKVELVGQYGYSIHCLNQNIIDLVLLVVNFLLFIAGIEIWARIKEGKVGVLLIILSAVCSMIEYFLSDIGRAVFPTTIIGLILWILSMNYGVYKLKQKV